MRRMRRNTLNKEYIKRDRIALGSVDEIDWSRNSIVHFTGLTLERLEGLEEGNFLNANESQDPGKAPTIRQFMLFMEEHPGFMAHGYVISPNRNGYGIVLEGLEFEGEYTDRTEADFALFCRRANDLTVEEKRLYSWWD